MGKSEDDEDMEILSKLVVITIMSANFYLFLFFIY